MSILAGVATLAAFAAARAVVAGRARARVRARLRRAPEAGPGGVPPWFERRWEDAVLPLPAVTAWRSWLALTAVSTVGVALVAAPIGGLVVGGAVAAAMPFLLHLRRGRRDALVVEAVPGLLDSVARSMRSGATVAGALAEAAAAVPEALAADLDQVVGAVAAGLPLDAALATWADRRPFPAVRLSTAALGMAREAGGPAARVVDGVAAGLRAEAAVTAEAHALAAQARMSGLVIALAPLAFGALAGLTDGRTASFLLATPAGLACLGTGLALDAAAVVWMRRVTAAV